MVELRRVDYYRMETSREVGGKLKAGCIIGAKKGVLDSVGGLSMVKDKYPLHLAASGSLVILLTTIGGIWKQVEGLVGREEIKT